MPDDETITADRSVHINVWPTTEIAAIAVLEDPKAKLDGRMTVHQTLQAAKDHQHLSKLTITGIELSNSSFAFGAPSGTTISTIAVKVSGGQFRGSLSLSGADADKFRIVSGVLKTYGVLAAGSYSINIIATQKGANNSPFVAPKTITGTTLFLTDILLSNSSFPYGSTSGRAVGVVSVQTTGGLFTGSYSLTGTDAAKFTIEDSILKTVGSLAAGSYSINIVATQAGATGSPLTVAKTITGESLTLTGITLSNSSFAFGAPDGTTVGTVSVQSSGGSFGGSLSLSGTDAANFTLDGSILKTVGALDPGDYSINIVATQSGATGSPLTSAQTITGRDSVSVPTMSAELTFPGGSPTASTLVFDIANGTDIGSYVAPSAGFTQHCIRVRHASLANFFIDFRPDDSGGRREVVCWNGETAGSVPSGYTRDLPAYNLVIKEDGSTVHTESVPYHYWGSRWRWQSAKRAVIRTAAQVFSQGFLPHMSSAAARITGYSGLIVPPVPTPAGPYTTFMAVDDIPGNRKLGLCADVDRGGERPELGLITEWQGDWLVRGTASSLATLIEHAEMCSGDWGWFLSDSVTGAPVDFKSDDAHYHMHTYQNGYDTGWYFIKYGTRNGWDIHEGDSHAPSHFYLPWVLTEDPYFIEAQQYFVQYGTGLTVYQRDVVFGPVGTRIVCSYPGEQRTLGNGVRNLAAAYRMTPASPPSWLLPQSYYAAVSEDYSAVFNHFYNTSTLPRHAIFHTLSGDPYFQAFEQAYAILGLGLADLVGMPTGTHPSWKDHLDFYFGFLEGITSANSGWNRQCPQPHDVLAGDLDTLPSPSWASAWAMWDSFFRGSATFPNAVSPGNQQGGSMGNCSMIVAACAVAKSRGVEPATAAKAWMDTFIDFNYPNNSDASMGLNFFAKCGFDGT